MSTTPDAPTETPDVPPETPEVLPATPDELTAPKQLALADVPAQRMPRHVAIIMDGNGRWARRQGLPRIEGHRRGAGVVRRITEECARLGIQQLTLYCLSSENWKRPAEEIAFLMQLLEHYMVGERSLIMEQNIRVSVIGRRDGIFEDALREMDQTVAMSAGNTGMRLCLAINYGSRAELVNACRLIAQAVRCGQLRPTRSAKRRLPIIFIRPACPSPICSFARRRRCG